jgi:hypothetical protein
MIKVLLINKEVGAYARIFPVSGASGKLYGHSVYCPQINAHVFEMSLEEWRKVREDVQRGAKIPNQFWLVDVMEGPEALPVVTPEAVERMEHAGVLSKEVTPAIMTRKLDSDQAARYVDLIQKSHHELKEMLQGKMQPQAISQLTTRDQLARAVIRHVPLQAVEAELAPS